MYTVEIRVDTWADDLVPHTFLVLKGPDEIEHGHGFAPLQHHSMRGDGKIYDDTNHPFNKTTGQIPLTQEEWNKLNNFINKSIECPPPYDLFFGSHCGTWVVKALAEAGIKNFGTPNLEPDNIFADLGESVYWNPYTQWLNLTLHGSLEDALPSITMQRASNILSLIDNNQNKDSITSIFDSLPAARGVQKLGMLVNKAYEVFFNSSYSEYMLTDIDTYLSAIEVTKKLQADPSIRHALIPVKNMSASSLRDYARVIYNDANTYRYTLENLLSFVVKNGDTAAITDSRYNMYSSSGIKQYSDEYLNDRARFLVNLAESYFNNTPEMNGPSGEYHYDAKIGLHLLPNITENYLLGPTVNVNREYFYGSERNDILQVREGNFAFSGVFNISNGIQPCQGDSITLRK